MATLKQIRANRLDAQKCTAPSSAEGKGRSSWNALKSRIQAESDLGPLTGVLPTEDPAERAALRAQFHDQQQPCTPEERAIVDNLVHGEFLSRRSRRLEVKIVISKLPAEATAQSPGPALSTPQPNETTLQTEQLDSFGKSPKT